MHISRNIDTILLNQYYCRVSKSYVNLDLSNFDYRHSFNGMEKDDEIKGEGNSYSTEFRQYDSRVGRWLSRDQLIKPQYSPYISFKDNPLIYVDPNGTDDIFDRKGNYKGSTPTGNDVRVLNKGAKYKDALDNPHQYSTSIVDLTYFPTDVENRAAIKKIAAYYGEAAGIAYHEIMFLEGEYSENGRMSTIAAWSPEDNKYVIYVDKNGKIHQNMNNKWHIISSAVHEGKHESDSKTGKPLDHIYAIIAQTEHSSFKNTSREFKIGMADYSVDLLNEAFKDPSVSKADVQIRVDDLNNSALGINGGGNILFYIDNYTVKFSVITTPVVTVEAQGSSEKVEDSGKKKKEKKEKK